MTRIAQRNIMIGDRNIGRKIRIMIANVNENRGAQKGFTETSKMPPWRVTRQKDG
jgi:hypothetical protein